MEGFMEIVLGQT